MKINIGYDTKSIDKALKQIEEYQKKVQDLIPTFLQRCAERIIERANAKIDEFAVGAEIVAEIKDGWYAQPPSITKKGASITIRNRSDKATYVEFGVGAVGESAPHDKAGELHYGYNLQSPSKYAGRYHDENTWRFYVRNKSEVDLIDGTYEDWETKDGSGRIKIITQGSPSTMFAYNATMDFAESREPADIMEELLKGLE